MAMAISAPRPALRLLTMLAAMLIGLTLISGRLIQVQALQSDRFEAMAAGQRERRIVLPPQRGSILDRDGAELAMSLEMKTLIANPKAVSDPAWAAASLAPLLGIDAAEIEKKLRRDTSFVYLARKLDPAVAASVLALGIEGVDSVKESKRLYPADQLAAHVLGFVGSENQGLGGLEARYEKLLAGLPGELLMERDPQGRSIPAGHSYTRPSTAGDDIFLTIDREVQFETERALAQAVQAYQAKGGVAMVMDPRTGEVLAMANLPTFNPNDVRTATPEARKNRALVDSYEPGSANKVITAAAAIEAGVIKPDDKLSVPDNLRMGSKVFRDSHPHPVETLTFAEVIQESSNVGTIKVALGLGKERMYEYLQKFGYGRPSGLDFPGEAGGILPPVSKWWDTSMGTIPIGQGVAVTGMQIMSVFSTLANDGLAVQPKLIAATIDSKGQRRATTPSEGRRVIKADTADQLTRILIGVTEGKRGTGSMAAVPGYQVAGKTGTAQKPIPGGGGYAGYISSFVGYAPASDPRLVVGVILDEPTPIWGGYTAAPTFRQIMQFSLRHLGIGPGPVLPLEGTPLPGAARSGGASLVEKGAPSTQGVAE